MKHFHTKITTLFLHLSSYSASSSSLLPLYPSFSLIEVHVADLLFRTASRERSTLSRLVCLLVFSRPLLPSFPSADARIRAREISDTAPKFRVEINDENPSA